MASYYICRLKSPSQALNARKYAHLRGLVTKKVTKQSQFRAFLLTLPQISKTKENGKGRCYDTGRAHS